MFEKIETSNGSPFPLGLSIQGDTANFSVFSSHANALFLALFSPHKESPDKEIPLQKSGDYWHVAIKKLPPEFDYSFKSSENYLADPYGKAVSTSFAWGDIANAPLHKRSKGYLQSKPFDWQGDTPPNIKKEDLIIYEMHVRGFTKHPSSKVKAPGTFLGLAEKIPYLKKLGINAIELLPIFEFDETHKKNIDPKTGMHLPNFWGYDPLHYFAPMGRYAHADPIIEFKTLVRECHKNGIEVILDVVYNHTGEEKNPDYKINFRGLDNTVYYMTDNQGKYLDFTGCGNTVNANHPVVQKLILDSLRYWVEEMHVDGFRFDLASILTRDPHGRPLAFPPILKAIADDPLVGKVKLISESWDAVGLYQVGTFPKWGPWSEWNGRYRDTIRRFIKGNPHQAGDFATCFCGSEMIYHSYNPQSSINFITAHDGFSLRDLVTYAHKHNNENGEMNQDGNSHNDSWNCGFEGPTHDPQIQALRERQMRNFLLALFLSQGVPMLLMGDEYGHTRRGNNNPYVQDNEINWFLWDELKQNEKIFNFVSSLISFRKAHASLRHTRFLTNQDVDWHGIVPFHPDWNSQFVALTLKPSLYFAFNASPHPQTFSLPPDSWKQIVNTAADWTFQEIDLPSQLTLLPFSALLAKSF